MSKLETKRFVIRKSLIGKNTIITFVNKKQEKVSYNHDEVYNTHKERFESISLFCSVTAHESVHSSGADKKGRLSRVGITDKKATFGSDLYATEELIAELGAFLICNDLQIDSNNDVHASYLDSWIKRLRKEPKHLLTVIGHAVKAKNLILGS